MLGVAGERRDVRDVEVTREEWLARGEERRAAVRQREPRQPPVLGAQDR